MKPDVLISASNRLVFGTPQLHIYIVSSDTNSTSLRPNEIIATFRESTFVPHNLGDGRTYLVALDEPILPDGTTLQNGMYKLLLKALRVSGNPENEEDWESWLSPVFGIQFPGRGY